MFSIILFLHIPTMVVEDLFMVIVHGHDSKIRLWLGFETLDKPK